MAASESANSGPAVAPRSLGYRPEIDGLRAVSIACVLLFHLGVPLTPGGYVGVDVFFVISGFLITRIILSALDERRFSFADFYARRAKRILPPLFAMLSVAGLFAFLLLTPKELGKFTEQALHAVFQISNIHFAEKVGYFEVDRTPSPLLHTWSLGVEEQFYLLWPLLLWFFLGARRRLAPALFFALTITGSFAIAALTIGSFERFTFYFLPPRMWELALGGALAVPSIASRINGFLRTGALREAALWLGLAMIAFAAGFYDKTTSFPAWAALPPVLGAALVIAASGAGPTFGGRLLSLPFMVFLGLISYSAYLWHWPMIIFTKLYFAAPALSPTQMVVIGFGALLAGWLSWRFIEKPTRHSLMSGRRTALVYSGVAAALAAALVAGGAAKEAPWRFAEPAGSSAALFGAPRLALHCLDTSGDPEYAMFDQKCSFGPAAPRFDVLLWGDSHAHHYFPAIKDWAEAKGLTVRLAAFAGCPPFLNGFRHEMRGVEQQKCLRHRDYIRAALDQNPGVKYVFFGLRYSSYFRRDDRFASQDFWDEERKKEGVAASLAAFERSMRRTLEMVRERGATPIILGEVPRLARDPEECVRRAGALLRRLAPLKQEAPCGQFNAAYNSGVKAISDAAMRRAAQEGDGVYFDAAAHLSAGYADGAYLYIDENHLTIAGAMTLRREMKF